MIIKILLLILCFVFQAYSQAYLPFKISKINPAQAYQLSIKKGVLVEEITKDSLLEKSDLQVYDIIITLDDIKINSAVDVQRFLNLKKVGNNVKITVLRKGKILEIITKLEKKPQEKFFLVETEKDQDDVFLNKNLLNGKANLLFDKLKKNFQVIINGTTNKNSFLNSSSTKFISDGIHIIQIIIDNGDRKVIIKNNQNKILFKGKINTKDEIAKIPMEIRSKVKKLLN